MTPDSCREDSVSSGGPRVDRRSHPGGPCNRTVDAGQIRTEFERKFAELCGLRHGIAVNSGTSSLEIILRSSGVEGKDVLVPTNTFFATAAAVVHAGGNPVLVDMDPESFAVGRKMWRRA